MNKTDMDVVLDFGVVVAECRRRALLSKENQKRAEAAVKNAQRIVGSKAFEGANEELADRDLTAAPSATPVLDSLRAKLQGV